MTVDAGALTRLGEYVERRIAELGLEYAAVCRAGGFSDETLSKIRKGAIKARPSTYRKLERALAWEQGSVDAILRGGEPTALTDPFAIAENAADLYAEHHAPAREAEEPQVEHPLDRSEALRRVWRSSAREFGVTASDLDAVFQAVRHDLNEAGPPRTDLSDLVRVGRAEAGLSLEAVAAATAGPDGERLVEADWLDRLERAALDPSEHPEYPQLDALVAVLHLDPAQVQEAAGVQFADVHTVWSEDGQVRGLVEGELSPEDAAKMQNLMHLYRKTPRPPRG
ncbi:Helix-turn-helix domain-containing protein [Streptomyces sp. DI166]|uniref:helix-turn-helix domain-containing protein n=1 Tax=Streptomyces sp. DI166 TaxID=1839783 RepID=UPI0007F497F2|nr:helix-turn-helix domain-containing protein [Streptomyces sp. DI166]SBT89418.1 Helix-turn-helix domain-containing protein [Streptomyces sp. DI166]